MILAKQTMMITMIKYIIATNIRLLGIETISGYLFGREGAPVQMISTFSLADKFKYHRTSNKNYFLIEVQNQPGTFWEINGKTLVYKYLGNTKPTEKNVFRILKKNENSFFHIQQGSRCLVFNDITKKFYLEGCAENETVQSFYAANPDDGQRIMDVLPPIRNDQLKLLVED